MAKALVKRKSDSEFNKIEERYWNGRQSAECELIYTQNGFRFKVSIDRDSYDFQCSAAGYVWHPTELKWNLVYRIPYKEMKSLRVFSYNNAETQKHLFQADILLIAEKMEDIVIKTH
jgi:hypothetical protein